MSSRSYGQPSKIVHINIIWSAVSKRRSRANARLERMQLVFRRESKLGVAVNPEATCATRIRRMSECQVKRDMEAHAGMAVWTSV